jgi:hypothetical protein
MSGHYSKYKHNSTSKPDWKTDLANTNINVWKLVKTSDDKWYAAKCHIPALTFYTHETGSKDTFTYRSEQLYVEEIGEFVLDPETYIYKFVCVDANFEAEPIINSNIIKIIYKKNHYTISPTGLWSYKYPWKVLWSLVNRSGRFRQRKIEMPKKFMYEDILYEYELKSEL